MPDDFKPTHFGIDRPPEVPESAFYITQIKEMLQHRFSSMETSLNSHIKDQFQQMKEDLREELKYDIKALVPDGDIERHRRDHEEENNSKKRWANFRFGLFEHVVKAGALGFAIYMALAIWDYFKRGVNQ